MGPGSLYTSIIPNLLVNGIYDAIKKSGAAKLYICNVMTQPGETGGYSVLDHIKAMEEHSCKGIVDCCIINNASIPEDLKEKYLGDGAEQVKIDKGELDDAGIQLLERDFVSIKNGYIRHDPDKLAGTIIDLVVVKILTEDRNRIADYYNVISKFK